MSTNGQPDIPAERGLPGFAAQLNDVLGDISTDVYGNPLCTTYQGEDPVTHVIPAASLDVDMMPVVATLGHGCYSDANGELVVPAPGHQPLHADGAFHPMVEAGSRRRHWKATTTGTPG